MTSIAKQVTKEWYHCKSFEKVLYSLWEENPTMRFKRQELVNRINRGDFGNNLVATVSPDQGSIQDKMNEYRIKGQEWLDIQELTYHYSHLNPHGHFHSQKQMLEHISGMGDNTIYSLHQGAFKSQ